MKCVNASFWDAWNDLGLPNPFAGLSGLFTELEKILMYVVAGLIALVLVFYTIKFVMGWATEDKK